MTNLEVRPFNSYNMLGGDRSLILTKDGGRHTLFEHEKSYGMNPPSQEPKLYKYVGRKGCNDGIIIRRNLETGAETSICPHIVELNYDRAKSYGLEFDGLCPKKIKAQRIMINDCGTKLDLIAHNGVVREILGDCPKIGENISRMTPFTKVWIKKYIDFLGKIR